ncbi:MAG: L-type lectin-domain containing protein [Planctomycetota bacterium]|jgi:hypothetical protein|nr:L-type lectin-domain containing protein [Planctomycetota bacterium]MDP6762566.1 L-type lectin-domain containing protein [Planctomycetota bacterium]MDP6990470.1 L-type lectin-domain containing protein [Planctomycetota bacterium]
MHLPIPAALLAAVLCAPAGAQSFTYDDFSDWTGISPVGLTTQSGSVLRLQGDLPVPNGSDNRGAAWYEDPVDVVGGFDTTFTYSMHTPSTSGGSDGMAFVIQNDQVAGVPIINGAPDGTGNQALGRHASAAGFGLFTSSLPGESVDNSVAIHLDTYANGSWGDGDNNHVSIHTGGSGDNSQHEDHSLGRVTPGVNLNDGLAHSVRVLYVPGTLEVHIDGTLVLSVAYDFAAGGTHLDNGTPIGGLDLIGGTSAYVGFTSGAGAAREIRDVHSWQFASAGGPGTAYCFGDGTGTTCPCGNPAASAEGCANSSGAGAALAGSGSAGVAADDLALIASNALPGQPGLFFQGNNAINGGAGVVFGDGLRCSGGTVIRLQMVVPDASGGAQTTVAIAAAGGVSAGDTRTYQYWYRDPSGSPCGAGFNLTNGYSVDWTP